MATQSNPAACFREICCKTRPRYTSEERVRREEADSGNGSWRAGIDSGLC